MVAQAPEPSRRGLIEQAQAEKVKTLHPYPVTTGERMMNKVEDITVNGGLHWHPFLENAYRGGGFALGAGYMHHVSSYNLLDVRGSYSITGLQAGGSRVHGAADVPAPRPLSVLGGYREATQVGFYGTRHRQRRRTTGRTTRSSSRTARRLMTLWPTRKLLMLRGGVEAVGVDAEAR